MRGLEKAVSVVMKEITQKTKTEECILNLFVTLTKDIRLGAVPHSQIHKERKNAMIQSLQTKFSQFSMKVRKSVCIMKS